MSNRRVRRFLVPVALLSAGLPGCTLLSFSTIGSLASLGNSSVSQGRDKYSFGKLSTAEMASFDGAVAATAAAAEDLGLNVRTPIRYDDRHAVAEVAYVDDNGTQVGVRVTRRTPRLVDLRVDVGWFFGSEVTDRLFLERLRAHLPVPAPRPARPDGPGVAVHD